MIRTTVVGSWPPAVEFTPVLEVYHQGQLPASETRPLDIQLDLPYFAMGLVDANDGWTTARAVAIIRVLFAGFTGIRRGVHFCNGDFMAQIRELLQYVPTERLLICPSCGLGWRTTVAIGKIQVMVEAI